MSVNTKIFGNISTGEVIHLFSITNSNGMCAVVTEYGAILVQLMVPDSEGVLRDVVLGYDNISQYENGRFFGATVGRHANRIANARAEIDGVVYKFAENEGKHNLHTDFVNGFHKKVWNYTILDNGVRFSVLSPDGECGFPGNLSAEVTYYLSDDNSLHLIYEAVSDKKTFINLTNHSFFNIGGHNSGNICEEFVTIRSDKVVELDKERIPTGILRNVDNSPMDFRTCRKIGDYIDSDYDLLNITGGYDQCWVIDRENQPFIRVEDLKSGIVLECSTDLPGFEFYTANWIPSENGKDGILYHPRDALCIETQYYPDSMHHPDFPQPLFDAGEKFSSETIYKFSVK